MRFRLAAVAALASVLAASSAARAELVQIVGMPSTDGSTTITTGGLPQALFGGAVPANGFKVAYPSVGNGGAPCWVSDTTTTPSASTPGSYPLYQQGQWATEPGERPAGPAYIMCPVTATPISAKRW